MPHTRSMSRTKLGPVSLPMGGWALVVLISMLACVGSCLWCGVSVHDFFCDLDPSCAAQRPPGR